MPNTTPVRKSHRRLIAALLLSLLITVAGPPIATAQTIEPDLDGPYVFWHDSTKATVFYLCGGEFKQETFAVVDTLRFRSLCREEPLEYAIAASGPVVEPDRFAGVKKIFAVSDIHGEYEALIDLLKNSGVVDDSLHWAWGDGHLVFDGDIFDRGDGVTETLWLVYRLEWEGKAAGGRVHFVLGNHDQMILRDDNRYVHEKYLDGTAKKSRIRHQDLYGPDMELGRWLRSKHTAVLLNDILFIHGGVSPQMVERGLTIDRLNEGVRAVLDLSSDRVAFSDEPKFLFGSFGPFWYRGLLIDMEDRYVRLTKGEVTELLEFYGARAVVVGHTEMDRVESYFDGLIYAIDVPLEDLGSLQGLLWEAGRFYRVTGAGERETLNQTD